MGTGTNISLPWWQGPQTKPSQVQLQPQQHGSPHITYGCWDGSWQHIFCPPLHLSALLRLLFPPGFCPAETQRRHLKGQRRKMLKAFFSRKASLLALTKSNGCLGEAEKHHHETCVLGYLCSLRWWPDTYIPLTRGERGEEPYILLLQQLLLLLCCHFALLNMWQNELRKQEPDQLSWENMNKMFGASFEFKNITKKIISNSDEGSSSACVNKSQSETKP